MDVSLFGFLGEFIGNIKAFLDASFLFAFIKFFLFVYTAVLLVDIVLLFMLRDVYGDLRSTLMGTGNRPIVSRNKIIRRWEAIRRRLESGNPSQYKAAVLEADALADEMLQKMGYKGENMRERLDQIQPYQIESKPDLENAHVLRNRIIHDANYEITEAEAGDALSAYARFFEEIELFS